MVARVLREHCEIVIVVVLFSALGIFFSVTTPLFEAPDEQWHFAFVQYVATGRGLPVQALDQPTHLARQEGSQPPLYYLLAAAATFWIDTSDYPGIVWENPHYGYNIPGIVNDNKNLFIHTSLESFPYHGAVLAIHLARLLSVLMGALAVLFTYLLTLEISPDRKYLAASAAALVAFVPQFLFVSSAVSNDSTIVAMSALLLWMIIRLLIADLRLPSAVVTPFDVAALGAVVGLTALAKVSGLGLAILAALVLVYIARNDWRKLARYLVVFGVTLALVAGWWYLRNIILYGELTGTAMMTRIFGAREMPLTMTQSLTQLREVWETFWVGFGWGNIRASPVIYTLIEIVVVLSAVGLLVGLLRRRDQLRATLAKAFPLFVLVLWITLVLVELVNWMQTTQAPHGRLLFPILPAFAPLMVFGLTQWVPLRLQPLTARAPAVVLFAIAAVAPFTTLQPAYAFPPSLSTNDVPKTIQRVDIAYGGKMKLLGYDVMPRRALPGESVTLTLYWQSLATMDADYSIGIHLLDANQRVVGARDSYPGHGMLPTRLWYVGQIIRDTYWLPVAADTSGPGVARIQVSLYTLEDKRDLPALDPNGKAVTPIIGQIKIASPNPVTPRVQNPTDYAFGKQIALIGYDIQPGVSLRLALYWKRIVPITDDYTVFVHILDVNGKIVAQKDQSPENGSDPTFLWDDGEVVVDPYAFDLPVGTYQIEVGLYRAETGERLSATNGKGNALGDHVMLTSFGVGR